MKHILIIFILSFSLSGCSTWVYKYDINQGNYLNQEDVNKLRISMTKEQVQYVLGTPVVQNSFKSDKWHYVYTIKSGKTDLTNRKELIVNFNGDALTSISGDFEQSEDFNKSLDEN
jgi:outer membrane protein assembly factor BamE